MQDAKNIVRNIRNCFAKFPHVVDALKRLQGLVEDQTHSDEPEHLMILGETGLGKSRLLKYFTSLYPRVEHDEFTEIPVLYLKVPSACTPKKLAGELLHAMGSPFWNKGDEQEKTHQLKVLIKQCKVRMIMLDEANHLVERGSAKTFYVMGDWLKVFSDEARIPLVLAGIPRAQELIHANEQLRSRFSEIIRIRPFSIADAQSLEQLKAALAVFKALMADLPCKVDFQDEAVVKTVFFATGGRLRELRKLFVCAIQISFDKPRPELTKKDLAEAFGKIIYSGSPVERNPFLSNFNGKPLTKAGEPFAQAGRT